VLSAAETYVGNFQSGEAPGISDPANTTPDPARSKSNPIGRILIADYTQLDNVYSNIKQRLSFFGGSTESVMILPIFSAEEGERDKNEMLAPFMGKYLREGGTLEAPYEKLSAGLGQDADPWTTKIILGGYVWFKYSVVKKNYP
jgi:hypothetical protein